MKQEVNTQRQMRETLLCVNNIKHFGIYSISHEIEDGKTYFKQQG